MNLLIFVIIGTLVGWLASLIMRTDELRGILLNIAVGIVGAFLGGWLISPMVGGGPINQEGVRIGSVFASLAGAILLLAVVRMFRRGWASW